MFFFAVFAATAAKRIETVFWRFGICTYIQEQWRVFDLVALFFFCVLLFCSFLSSIISFYFNCREFQLLRGRFCAERYENRGKQRWQDRERESFAPVRCTCAINLLFCHEKMKRLQEKQIFERKKTKKEQKYSENETIAATRNRIHSVQSLLFSSVSCVSLAQARVHFMVYEREERKKERERDGE